MIDNFLQSEVIWLDDFPCNKISGCFYLILYFGTHSCLKNVKNINIYCFKGEQIAKNEQKSQRRTRRQRRIERQNGASDGTEAEGQAQDSEQGYCCNFSFSLSLTI